MDVDSNDVGFEVGRRRASSSSRESSPAAKRQKRSFTPPSDDGDLAVPNEDDETPTPENQPLIRQAVGFSWTPSVSANVNTYQATVAQEVAPHFLPGQAPSPPKPKTPKPRAPRRKKGEQYSDRTSKFKIHPSNSLLPPGTGFMNLVPASAADSANTNSSGGAVSSSTPLRSMAPSASRGLTHANGSAAAGPSSNHGAVVPPLAAKRTRKTSKRKSSPLRNEPRSQSSVRPSTEQPAQNSITITSQYPVNDNSRRSSGQAPEVERTRSVSPCIASSGVPDGRTNASTAVTRGSTQGTPRPLRMVTLLIEDMRSGVPDLQLAEIKIPLRVADDPEDGFWADAIEICNALQGGPSRIDGPAKVYTMRGRFRQFFMRVDHFDQPQVQSAHLGVTKQRTLNVYVEAPVPRGQLPPPPAPLLDVRPVYNSGSEREAISSSTSTHHRPAYPLVTREDQIERLSRSNYTMAERRMSPVSENGSYGHSRRTASPNARHRSSRYNQRSGSIQRPLTPPIPGRLADTQEEKDEAIANYIRSHIENHSGWIEYMQSKAKPQRVSEVLKQYTFVEDRVRELTGRKTPAHWDGAPSSYVEKQHVWRVLKLDTRWGEECEETLVLIAFYGKRGTRYEDSRVVDMINDTSPPKANAMDKFLRLLRSVDDRFTQDTFSGQPVPALTQE